MTDDPRGDQHHTPGLAAEVRAMARLAGPVVLAELGWMVMGLVDISMVGRLGPCVGRAGDR